MDNGDKKMETRDVREIAPQKIRKSSVFSTNLSRFFWCQTENRHLWSSWTRFLDLSWQGRFYGGRNRPFCQSSRSAFCQECCGFQKESVEKRRHLVAKISVNTTKIYENGGKILSSCCWLFDSWLNLPNCVVLKIVNCKNFEFWWGSLLARFFLCQNHNCQSILKQHWKKFETAPDFAKKCFKKKTNRLRLPWKSPKIHFAASNLQFNCQDNLQSKIHLPWICFNLCASACFQSGSKPLYEARFWPRRSHAKVDWFH